jgi:sensor c-di-GMP phosphodiesterase-like protein
MSVPTEVKAALYGGNLFLEYLPMVSLRDHRCVGAEALIRRRRGSQIIKPLQFIPLIENTPVSGLVTYWVIDTVAKELATWLRAHDGVHLAINIPPEVFGRGGLEYAAAKSNLLSLANKFVLEITERGVPDKLGVAELNARRRGGVLVALDDVGASETSLLVASQVRVDILKLDKACVGQMARNEWSAQRMATLASLIHAADVAVIAEGVETDVQEASLRNAGIEMGQGWLFSHPLSATDFMKYFSAHQG